ncbi:S16 family serine protease [Glaciihabitans sp. UYNi722]|uniref:YlbL family protein n=1 Tax=Glaciihabitans sp. UYNi722 TaxID=3156344 RepID=UPI003391495F
MTRIGWTLLLAALFGTFAFATLPTPYVIEQPGPVFNTLGKVSYEHHQVPLIDIPDEKTYPTSGTLDMLTVNVAGSREQSPSWLEVAQAWLDSSQAVLPIDLVYPQGESQQQSNEAATIDMQNSQKDAVAAALTKLGYTFPSALTVGSLSPKSPSDGVLKNGDTIVSVNGETASTVLGLRAIIAKTGAGTPVNVDILRDGKPQTLQVTPVLSSDTKPAPIIGIIPAITYTFPFTVKIQLENVGGPSAGQMFALGIIDKLTPGELNGGANVAGTGTITAEGEVGAIGGIRQKMYGALDAGARWFLAPYSNCDEMTGHIPKGLTVLAVKNLDDSLAALKAIRTKADTSKLLTCPAG